MNLRTVSSIHCCRTSPKLSLLARLEKRSAIRFSALIFTTLLGALTAYADPASQQEDGLIAILASESPKADKAITCKHLAIHGSSKAVPELSKLLSDPQLTSWARIALEAIPDSSAGQALIAALPSTEGNVRIGVINSLGVRRETAAVPALVELFGEEAEDTIVAAAIALGHIGTAAAEDAVVSRLAHSSAKVRDAAASACILIAEQRFEAGQVDEANAVYAKVRSSDVAPQRKREAIRGLILAEPGTDVLASQLSAKDEEAFWLALRTAREKPAASVTKLLVDSLQGETEKRQSLIVLALAERKDESVVSAIMDAAQSGSASVRASAMQVLAKAGSAASLPTLLKAASDQDELVSKSALDALARIEAAGIDEELKNRLKDSSTAPELMKTIIETIGQRRIPAIQELTNAAESKQEAVRHAAILALGSVVDPDNFSLLLERLSKSRSNDSEVIQQAILNAAVRMPNPNECADLLAKAMSQVDVEQQCTLLKTLGLVGGESALKRVGEAAKASDDRLKDTASQVLGRWMTPDAASVLIKLAEPKAEGKYGIRALRGYLRIARQMQLSNAQRAEMAQNALRLASRSDERELAVRVLEIHPGVETLLVAYQAKKVPGLEARAKKAIAAISTKLGGDAEKMQQLVEKLDLEPAEIKIQKAVYGAGDKQKDVTETLQKLVGKLPIITLPNPSYNSAFGGDPAPGVVKKLTVNYTMNGQAGSATFKENAFIMLPVLDN